MKKVLVSRNGISLKIKLLIFSFSLSILLSESAFPQIQTDVPHLKDVYKNDFYIGCLLSYRHVGFPSDPVIPGQSSVIDPNGGYLIQFHMNSMSPGNNMKPQNTVDISASAAAYNSAAPGAERDSVDVHPVVRFIPDMVAQLNWAQRQGFTFRGHTLVWHNQTPGTAFFRTGYSATGTRLTKEKMTQRLGNYIKEIIRLLHENWPGLLSAFDVVNEAVNDNGTDRTTDSEWYTTFGDNSYIMKAFEFARQYTEFYDEEQIKLYYNDYNTSTSTKANGIVRVCGPIFRAGYLDGIGMQEHDANASPTAAAWIASYNKFDTICTEMAVTELDVNPGSGTPSPAALQTQANQYGVLLKCFVERSFRSGRGKIINVSKDGLNDLYAFVANASLWTSADQCKPAFFSVAEVGLNYNSLDSLISYADSLQESNYTPSSWSNFAAALTSAKNSRDLSYSNTESAGDILGSEKDNLQSAINNLIDINVPVELISFNSVVERNNVNLYWETATEINNNGFQIYRNGYLIGFRKGSGTSSEKHSYSFQDKALPSGKYAYKLEQVDFEGTRKVIGELTAVTKPLQFSLEQNYPNPFNPSTTITYSIPQNAYISLRVFNIQGEEVETLFEGLQQAGSYSIKFDAGTLAGGVYFYQLKSNEFMETKKLLLLK